ncbi:MAG: hypothetical protein K8R25_01215 [Methanosarcinales archaeon]|nr:hypothetical protein [Methanosarcinales archaeon]
MNKPYLLSTTAIIKPGSYTFLILLIILTILSASHPASAQPRVEIISLFSDENSMDITLQSQSPIENGHIELTLSQQDDIIRTRTIDLDMPEDSQLTKVIIWDTKLHSNAKSYTASASIYSNDELINESSYKFSYGFVTLPRFKVIDLSATSSGASVLLSPRKLSDPTVADITFELIHRNEIIYSKTKEDISIIQSTPLSINWPILLKDNTDYIVRVKAYSHTPQITSSYITEFTSCQDIEIDDNDVDVDDFGASVTLFGRSQVPFDGKVEIELRQEGAEPLIYSDRSEILTLNRDDTVGIIWNDLDPGVYKVFILVKTLKGDILDRYETVLLIPEPINPISNPTEQTTPGFNIILSLAMIVVSFTLVRKS